MDKFLNNMELITGTIKDIEVINKKSKIKTTDGEAMILNRKEVVKVIKDLQSFYFLITTPTAKAVKMCFHRQNFF